ncbi:hypothetical protein O1611_g10146 [Lasiodiplodia mahajangana]|uniref:Uncharacterized protein n=1 Tax=Lasiodiplodia mahajangana TaxID=1108764 RepID=A0ACC2J1G5_9PEZI|nr:hypothetical protein O1611_g10146 [Lasiodiplodia mahajangana]
MLHHLNNVPEAANYITQLIDEFEHHGPNGVHKCLVFEPMGPNVNMMVEELPQFKPRRREMKVRYPYWMAKGILKQSLQALVFLHGNGIAHGDFQPGNMLFALNDIDSKPEDELRQREDVQARIISPPVERLDGKQDKWAPRYLCVAQPVAYPTDYATNFKIKLSDMGGAFTSGLGALPDHLYKHWTRSSLYFTPERELYNCHLGGVPEGEEPLMLTELSMEELFDEQGLDIPEEEAGQVKALVRRILQYDPAKRPSPMELLRDPWFANEDSSGLS